MAETERTGRTSPPLAPLEGLRVVDFSRMLSGPLATMILGDLGAHVIRVEDLEGTDTTRHNHPFINGESHYFLSFNRNKESISIDLKTEAGRRIAVDLVRQADIVVENFRHGVASRLGLDYESLKAINPPLIYCSITGFGQTGPWRDKTAYDLVIQAVTGALSITGESGRPPAKMGLPLADEMSSLFAGIAVLAGIRRRERTGLGCYLDISMFDGGVSMLSYLANIFFATGVSPGASGSAHEGIFPYNAFDTADGQIVVAAITNAFWRNFCEVIGRPDLSENPKYRLFKDRVARRDELATVIEPLMKQHSTAYWAEALEAGDVPNGPVTSVPEAIEMAHSRFRGMITEFDHPVCGRQKTLGSPFHIGYADGSSFDAPRRPPPVVGQHTSAILETLLGYDAGLIRQLAEARVVRTSEVPGSTAVGPRSAAPEAPPRAQPCADALPLEGLRVLDLTRMLSGPYGTMIIGDLGADVIKVEAPGTGDPTRHNVPRMGDHSTYFMALNRGKRSITLDLKSEEGREALLRLVRTSDVVVENFRPGVMQRLGLGYHALCGIKPDIILCSISGFGQTGPLKDKTSFDLVNQAMSGVMSVTGEEGRGPVRAGLPVADLAGGIYAAMGILASLYNRSRHGTGMHLDLSMHDILVSLLGYVGQLYFTTGEVPRRVGSGHYHVAPYRAFLASDGYFVISAFTQVFWEKFARAMAMPGLLEDPRFADLTARKHNMAALYELIDPVFLTRTVDEWVELFHEADVPSARVNTVGDAVSCEHAKTREIVFAYEHPDLGRVRAVGTPFRCNGRPWRASLRPPALGEHNVDVLGAPAQNLKPAAGC